MKKAPSPGYQKLSGKTQPLDGAGFHCKNCARPMEAAISVDSSLLCSSRIPKGFGRTHEANPIRKYTPAEAKPTEHGLSQLSCPQENSGSQSISERLTNSPATVLPYGCAFFLKGTPQAGGFPVSFGSYRSKFWKNMLGLAFLGMGQNCHHQTAGVLVLRGPWWCRVFSARADAEDAMRRRCLRLAVVAPPPPSPPPVKAIPTPLASQMGGGCGSHFGVGAPPILVYLGGEWDVHWGYGILTHGHQSFLRPHSDHGEHSSFRGENHT